jgi:hypothetical protein
MRDIVKDVSVLSTVPDKTLDKLIEKGVYCISDALLEDIDTDKDVTELNIGIGTLYIKHTADTIAYKFMPSDEFANVVKSTVKNKQNLLSNVLDETLSKKFLEVYKDIC